MKKLITFAGTALIVYLIFKKKSPAENERPGLFKRLTNGLVEHLKKPLDEVADGVPEPGSVTTTG